MRYENEVLFDPLTDDPIVLERAFASLRQAALDAGDITIETRDVEGAPVEVVAEAVRILGHKWSLWSTHEQILHTASRPGIDFWKVQFALFVPDE